MADQSDVMDALYGFSLAAIYPNGTSSTSITGKPVDIGEGWPLPGDVDKAMKAQRTLVTIFPFSITSDPGQVLDNAAIVVPPVHGLTVTQNIDGSITLVGTPGVGEYVTFVLDRNVAYSVAAVQGDTAATMATKIAAATAVGYPGTIAAGGTVTVVGFFSLIVSIGAPGTLGQKTHRQKDWFNITTWAPDPAARTKVAAAIDNLLKRNISFNLPDTSRALMTFQRTISIDRQENLGEYRRDLIYAVQYDTLDLFQGYEVTSVTINGLGTPKAPVLGDPNAVVITGQFTPPSF